MEPRKIVLIGKTGDGKSSAGNTILRKKVFTPKASAKSATAKCATKQGLVHGRKITVIDTPGFIDTDREDKEMKSEITKTLVDCAPGVDAFVIVIKVGRYTRHENEVIQQFLNTMKGEYVLKHTLILFTHGDQLEGQTIEEFMKDCPQLQELVDKCGSRCHVIDNKYWNKRKRGYKSNRVQVKNLLDTIDKMVRENGCYTNELLQKMEEEIQEEVKNITDDNLTPEEKREKAKGTVQKILQGIGATTGVLIGALLGVGVALAAVHTPFSQALSPLNALIKAKIAGGAAAVQAAGGRAAIAGGAAVEAVVAGGGAAAEAVVAGGAAAEAVVAGGAAAEAVVAGGAAVEAVVAGEAAVGAGVSAGTATAIGVLTAAALAGAVVGGVTGWKAAEDADSVCDAMTKAAKVNYEKAKVMVEKVHEFTTLAFNNKLQ